MTSEDDQHCEPICSELLSIVENRFLAKLAHELRSSTHTLRGLCEILSQSIHQDSLPIHAIEALAILNTVSNELGHTVKSLSNLAHCTDEKDQSAIDVGASFRSIWQKVILANHCDNAELSCPLKTIHLYGDVNCFEYAIGAILENAVRFRKSTELLRVRVEAKVTDDSVSIYCSDNGAGVPRNFQHDDISPFQSLNVLGNNRRAGLGLFTVKTAVMHMNGRIAIERRSDGETTVELLFPAAQLVSTSIYESLSTPS